MSSIGGATLAGFDLPTAQTLFDKDGKLDQIRDRRRRPASRRQQLIAEVAHDPAARHAGADRRRAGDEGRGGHERLPVASCRSSCSRFGGDRALRRRVRDRELALDHDRAADARVRDAADARRLAPPGARARCCSSRSSIGVARLGRRALPRARAREGAVLALRRVRLHAAEQRAAVRAADDRRLAARRDRSSRCSRASGPALRATRVPADRRRARGRRRCRRAASPASARRARSLLPRSASPLVADRALRRARHRPGVLLLDAGRRAARLHRRRALRRRSSSGRSPACSAGRRLAWAASRVGSPATTRSGIRSARRRRRPR